MTEQQLRDYQRTVERNRNRDGAYRSPIRNRDGMIFGRRVVTVG